MKRHNIETAQYHTRHCPTRNLLFPILSIIVSINIFIQSRCSFNISCLILIGLIGEKQYVTRMKMMLMK
ncbi:unnamed protein product [Rhizophagus irregularis]|nr:unnamed protein product [Rhizophagus irregularis]